MKYANSALLRLRAVLKAVEEQQNKDKARGLLRGKHAAARGSGSDGERRGKEE
jgi:hypothetical protein